MQMYMVNIYSYGHIFPIRIVLPHLLKFRFQVFRNALVQDFSSEPRYPYNVVLRTIYRMCCFNQPHAYIIPCERKTQETALTPAFTGGELPLD